MFPFDFDLVGCLEITFKQIIEAHVAHIDYMIEIIGSNKLYYVYILICITHFMIAMPIFSRQGGTVFIEHPVHYYSG